ncbi:hypothetical protein [Rhizobium sp. PL01]|uniref:hypothetical protein n=1 Tax=Rhizobium sp. PL01 TaxID=3085631 RepID=UPI0029824647|nr:hypothetical protein [Rhizobium sp. PL01]MDW5317190.1 hypothetical protein [Rhizobium sp. PL01]
MIAGERWQQRTRAFSEARSERSPSQAVLLLETNKSISLGGRPTVREIGCRECRTPIAFGISSALSGFQASFMIEQHVLRQEGEI